MLKMGFLLDKVNLGASHLPEAIEAQLQQKMAAQQQALQAEYELQKQTTLAKAKVAQAQGEAESTLVRARAGGSEHVAAGDFESAADSEQSHRQVGRLAADVQWRRRAAVSFDYRQMKRD